MASFPSPNTLFWCVLVSKFIFMYKVWFEPRKQLYVKRNKYEYQIPFYDGEEVLLKHFTYWRFCDLKFLHRKKKLLVCNEFKCPNLNSFHPLVCFLNYFTVQLCSTHCFFFFFFSLLRDTWNCSFLIYEICLRKCHARGFFNLLTILFF